jgi:hypothetical protein
MFSTLKEEIFFQKLTNMFMDMGSFPVPQERDKITHTKEKMKSKLSASKVILQEYSEAHYHSPLYSIIIGFYIENKQLLPLTSMAPGYPLLTAYIISNTGDILQYKTDLVK